MQKEYSDDIDDIEALKKTAPQVKRFSDEEMKKLRNDVKKIIEEREKREKKLRRAEMEEHFYELSLYA